MSTLSGGPNIVTDRLVSLLDTSNPKSYTSGSLKWDNLVTTALSGSILNGNATTLIGLSTNPTALYVSQSSANTSNVFTTGLRFTENASIELWYKTDTTGSGIAEQSQSPGIIQIGSYASNSSLTLWDWSAGTPGQHTIRTYVNNGTVWSHTASSPLYLDSSWVGKYHQIVLNFSGSAGKWNSYTLYVDTLLAYTINFTIPFPSGSIAGGNTIYAPGANGGSARNSYALVRQHTKALTAQEILQNYNATKTRFGL
jgi:hypothetical protein